MNDLYLKECLHRHSTVYCMFPCICCYFCFRHFGFTLSIGLFVCQQVYTKTMRCIVVYYSWWTLQGVFPHSNWSIIKHESWWKVWEGGMIQTNLKGLLGLVKVLLSRFSNILILFLPRRETDFLCTQLIPVNVSAIVKTNYGMLISLLRYHYRQNFSITSC